MKKAQTSISLAILGIVAVIAVVGLVLIFARAPTTGQVGGGAGGTFPAVAPAIFEGRAFIDGSPAPHGTQVVALINGCATPSMTSGKPGNYRIVIHSGENTGQSGCGVDGAVIRFEVGGLPAATATWRSGAFTQLNLVAQAAPSDPCPGDDCAVGASRTPCAGGAGICDGSGCCSFLA